MERRLIFSLKNSLKASRINRDKSEAKGPQLRGKTKNPPLRWKAERPPLKRKARRL